MKEMNRYYKAWRQAEADAEEAKIKAQEAKANGDKSSYEFWLLVHRVDLEIKEEMKKADELVRCGLLVG